MSVSAVLDRRHAGWVVAQELPPWSSFRTDIRRVGWVVVADRLAACEIIAFLRFAIHTGVSRSGVGEGRKAAAKP